MRQAPALPPPCQAQATARSPAALEMWGGILMEYMEALGRAGGRWAWGEGQQTTLQIFWVTVR